MERISLTIKEKRELIEKLGAICVYCGCTSKFLLNIDHKTPICSGGEDNDKNKQITCIVCNHLKADLTHTEFKKYVKILNDLWSLNKIRVPLFSPQFIFKAYNNINPPLPKPVIESNKRLVDDKNGS